MMFVGGCLSKRKEEGREVQRQVRCYERSILFISISAPTGILCIELR